MRKNILLLAISLLASLGLMQSASAGVIVDNVGVYEYVGWGGSTDWTHNILDDGFSPGSLLSATIEVEIWDDRRGYDEFFGPELALIVVDDFDFDTGGLSGIGTFFNNVEIQAFLTLNATGQLDIELTSLWGDFFVGESTLTAYVPEPEMMLLLGTGLLGLALTRRRRRLV